MGRNKNYSLGLYEKAIPAGLSFAQMLGIAGRCGFDRLEISIDESGDRLSRLNYPVAKQHELRSMVEDSGIPISTMCLSGHRKYPFGSHDPAIRDRSLTIMKKAIDFSCEVGVRIIQLAGYDVYYEENDSQTKAWFFENLEKATEFAARSGIVLAFETMETPFMDTVGKAMEYVKMIDSPWLGVYPDIGNLQNAAVKYGHDVVDDLITGSGHIFAMHLKETSPGIYRNMRFGEGHTRYSDCLKYAAEHGIRLFTGEFWYQDGQNYIQEITTAAAFLRERLDEAFGS